MCSAILVGLHFLIYIPDALATAFRELRARLSWLQSLRLALVVVALALGLALAFATYGSGVWPSRQYDRRESSVRQPASNIVMIVTHRRVEWHMPRA